MEPLTASPLLLAMLALAAGMLCVLVLVGGIVGIAALALLVVVAFLIGYTSL